MRISDWSSDVCSSDLQALSGVAGKVRHQGAAARYAGAPTLDEAQLAALIEGAERALVLVLDGIQDPHNFGACLRSAAAAGVTVVVVPRDRAVGITDRKSTRLNSSH